MGPQGRDARASQAARRPLATELRRRDDPKPERARSTAGFAAKLGFAKPSMLGRLRFVGLDDERFVAARATHGGRLGLDDCRRRHIDRVRGRASGREVDQPVARADELLVVRTCAPSGRARSNRALGACHRLEHTSCRKAKIGRPGGRITRIRCRNPRRRARKRDFVPRRVALAARGLRNMDAGDERIEDPIELHRVRAQSRSVHIQAALLALAVAAFFTLLRRAGTHSAHVSMQMDPGIAAHRFALRSIRGTPRRTLLIPQPCRMGRIAVGTLIAERPPHRTVRARLRHTAPTLGV